MAALPVVGEQGAVIDAATCSERNVYFIGPHGSRVSFASQQRRVLNLIWALHEARQLPVSGQIEVAVIGAGIAGITAVAALRSLDLNVTIIEKSGHAMALQEASSHRTIHPTINFWPQEDLQWTTKLPFFDWFAGTASEIIGHLYNDWTRETLGDCKPLFNTTVDKIRYDPDERKVRVKTPGKDYLFDLVFVATGFGKERNCDDESQNTYWNGDDIHQLVTSSHRVLVSGTGDGGVIDALRLVYRRFMENETALRYLLAINSDRFQETVQEIELVGAAIEDLDTRAAHYAREYTKLAKSRPPNAQNLLQPATPLLNPKRGREPKIVLMGKRTHPFEISSAPIHRLILAHTLNKRWIAYRRGSLDRDKKTGAFFYVQDGIRHDVTEDVVIVRHGAVPPVADLIGKPAADRLAASQMRYGDFMHVLGMDEDFFDDRRRDRSFIPNSHSLAGLREDFANFFARKRFGGRVVVQLLTDETARFHASPLDGTTYSEEFGPRPSRIFNVNIHWGFDAPIRLDMMVAGRR